MYSQAELPGLPRVEEREGDEFPKGLKRFGVAANGLFCSKPVAVAGGGAVAATSFHVCAHVCVYDCINVCDFATYGTEREKSE